MINMKYEIWENTCKSFFNIDNNVLDKYLQLFPFTRLTIEEKEKISSETFFNTFIKGGALFSNVKTFDTPTRYLQKADGSFRITKLVSPIIYLYLLSIGTQVSKLYTSKRNSARVYHSGNVSQYIYHYSESYDSFFADINESQRIYKFFIKIDLTNFYDSLKINDLFLKINKDQEILDPRTILIYKNILNLIGNESYPIVENNSGLSFLATEVYLDDTDSAIEKYFSSFEKTIDFQLIRYVDDLWIFINSKDDIDNIITEIKNELINIYSKAELSINESKFKYGKTEDIHEVLYTSLYDFYVNGLEMDFDEFYKESDLFLFFNNLVNVLDNHSHDIYFEVLENSFKKKGIQYSADEILRRFLYDRKHLFQTEEIKGEILKLVDYDYNIIKYSITEMVMAICNTTDGTIIKKLLSKIFDKYKSSKGDIFDEVIIISYLVNRNFEHNDLREILSVLNEEVSEFIKNNCRQSFLTSFENEMKFDNLTDHRGLRYYLLIDDSISWYLYFMHNYHKKLGKELEAYSYLKVFFDRFIAHVMNCKGIDTSNGKNKPNVKRYHKHGIISKDLTEIGIKYIGEQDIGSVIESAHNLRNEIPLNHASSKILIDKQVGSSELTSNKTKLLQVIKLCLERCN